MLDIIRKAADRVGGIPRLARHIGVTRQAIYQWREIPADRVGDIAILTGVPRADLRPDLFAISPDEAAWAKDARNEAAKPDPTDFAQLRRDFLVWADTQGAAILAGHSADIDYSALADVLRSIAEEARADIERRLAVVIVRLLKWQHRPDRRSLSTIGVMTAERARILSRLATSPALKTHARDTLQNVYIRACLQASDETGLAPDKFPADCPFSFEMVLDPAFAPPAIAAA